ncbi:MAG: PAS domain S-box protein [Thermodesulfobacteriota bacterium]
MSRRINLSTKIFAVFLLLTLVTLAQGGMVLTSVSRLRLLNEQIQHIKDFQVQVNRLESLQAELNPSSFEGLRGEIERRFSAVRELTGVIRAEHSQAEGDFHHRLQKVEQFISYYLRATYELVDAYAKDAAFTKELPARQHELYTALIEHTDKTDGLEAAVLDFLAYQDQAFHLNDPGKLGAMRRIVREVEARTADGALIDRMASLMKGSEDHYLNGLAILDRRSFLRDTADNCFLFSEKAISDFTAAARAAQQRMVVLAIVFVLASVLLTVLLWLASTRYFHRFLAGQRQAIAAIEEGRYAFDLPPQSNDELGDLALFMQKMGRRLGQSIELVTRSEEKYRALIETTDTGFVILDCQGRVLDANDIYARLAGGQQPEDVIGRKVEEWTVAEDREATVATLALCRERGGIRNRVVEYGLRRGEGVAVELNATLVGEDDGPVIMALVRDITERRRAENALAAEKERLAVTLRSIGDGVITTDTEGRIVLVNKVAEELTGWRQAEAAGRPLPEVFHIVNERTGEICENPVEKVLTSGQIVGLANHTALIARDGRQRSIADSGAPIRDRMSRIIGVVLVFRDVTEKHQMEKELQKAQKLESVGVLAGGIAHDFNNILTAILGNISIAGFTLETDRDRTRRLLHEAEQAVLRARDLTGQLLTFSKGGAPIRKSTDLGAIIRDSAGFVLSGSNCALEIDCPGNLWLADVDPGQISQVIHNIVLNARHAMPTGGTVRIACDNVAAGSGGLPAGLAGDHIRIDISDTGSGMTKHVLENIFDPYFTTKQEGSGLGLAVCHSIIQRHGGHIRAASVPGDGTTFTFFLPAASNGSAPRETTVEDPVILRGSGRILLLDDEATLRNMTGNMLRQLGYEATCASDGTEAVSLYRQARAEGAPFAATILDLTIPGGMGGRETAARLLAEDPAARLIVSSGYSNDPVMADYRGHGFMDAVSKPYRLTDLAACLHRVLGQETKG